MSALTFPTAPKNTQSGELQTIESGSFWPTIDLDDLRQALRVDTTVLPQRLMHAATAAVAHTNSQLDGLRLTALQSGITRLADVQPRPINGVSLSEHRYRRAVYCYTKAALLETYADYDAAGKTASRADAKQEQAEDYRRDGHYAIADLYGRRRNDAELI